MSWQSNTRYETAMYWPIDGGYGGDQYSETEEQARARAVEFSTDSCVKSGVYRDRRVHSVVAEAMLGRKLRHDEDCHHEDTRKLNNDPSNLRVIGKSLDLLRIWENRHCIVCRKFMHVSGHASDRRHHRMTTIPALADLRQVLRMKLRNLTI